MKQNKMKIAVTGGIGSGKSTVCKIIEDFGYPVFSCDKTYAEMLNDGFFNDDLVKEFGRVVIDSDGKLNRTKLGEIVFSDGNKLQRLNSITHPKIFDKMFADAENCTSQLCFFEVPILFDYGYEKLFDNVIVVLREEEERIRSVMSRDNISSEAVSQRVKNQYNYQNNDFAQYYVIHNNCNFGKLSDKIEKILLKITQNQA